MPVPLPPRMDGRCPIDFSVDAIRPLTPGSHIAFSFFFEQEIEQNRAFSYIDLLWYTVEPFLLV